jgi:hypothetical protein
MIYQNFSYNYSKIRMMYEWVLLFKGVTIYSIYYYSTQSIFISNLILVLVVCVMYVYEMMII